MQTIIVKPLMPTRTQGRRIKASTSYSNTSITLGWDYGLTDTENALEAIRELKKKVNWEHISFHVGDTQSGWVGVCTKEPVV